MTANETRPPLRVALLAAANSIHTVRWVNALADRGYETHLITMHEAVDPIRPNVTIHQLKYNHLLGYFLHARAVRRILATIRPDLLHSHYASGYGTLGRLSRFHPSVLSVWGSDVYDFPETSFLHRSLINANLKSADWVCSTSHCMGEHTKDMCPEIRNLTVTPFGIDLEAFRPSEIHPKQGPNVTIGTVKTLAAKYGIDLLIKAVAGLVKELRQESHPAATLVRLLIVGDGPLREELTNMAAHYGISEITEFAGRVPYEHVPDFLTKLDVYVAASRLESESFGVAVVEASACAIPVVVTNIGGLPEVVRDGVTGLVVESENVGALTAALKRFALDKDLRVRMGNAGREHVCTHYDWDENVTRMENVYAAVVDPNTVNPAAKTVMERTQSAR